MTAPSTPGGTQSNAGSVFQPGTILYLLVQFPQEDVPHNKYFVFVGLAKRPLLLKINSDNSFTTNNQHLREFQFKIKPTTYTFLHHESYIDCGTVWYMLSMDEINSQIQADSSRIIGNIIKDHCNEIIRLTNLSKSINNIHKNSISTFLRS